ncbi:AraC-type DNA-binding protein [Chitinophaga sp. CF118]|uniref:helix-turn-helix domain-containing protein n=1 Tax=Chitinophaga sp. CF118 TaxID=1884367 RepID=UPI0008DF2EA4|nr:helix-turn-helix domain-containing protein [Chitinophaga sp. CF118]SFF10805.1 AraC-type DNA-binding protein [Chitinophaga sp. CF118]
MKTSGNFVPIYQLDPSHQEHHRDKSIPDHFGYHQLPVHKHIPGFEIYSTEGVKGSYGPAKSNFYRVGIMLQGSLEMQIGLEHFHAIPGTISFTIPGQVHSKWNISPDIFGYYILFDPSFLETLIPSTHINQEFPFLHHAGIQLFHCSDIEINELNSLFLQINKEVQEEHSGRATAVKMYLYLLLLTARRIYEKQELGKITGDPQTGTNLVTSFYKLVGQHFLQLRQVSDYARLLHVTPNHLNRIIKNTTGKTASDAINEMLIQEAKVLLKYTTLSAAEIAYQLDFSEPAAFSHFFKNLTDKTPLSYRQQTNEA